MRSDAVSGTALESTGTATGWRALVGERLQLPALLVVATAQAASAQYVVAPSLDVGALVAAAGGIAALLGMLRLMDELKDLDKDRVAHPDRPLPRGALSERTARRGLRWGVAVLLLGAASIGMGISALGGVLYGLCVCYALLMYVEFFAPAFLEERPFTYALTHQIVVVPLYVFATAVAVPDRAISWPVLWFGMTGLGASFAFEVCRKLDPGAHPALRTYLTVYGAPRTMIAVVAAVALAGVAAYRIDVHLFVWPAASLLLVSLPIVVLRPERFRWVEGAASVFALTQILSPTLAHFLAGR